MILHSPEWELKSSGPVWLFTLMMYQKSELIATARRLKLSKPVNPADRIATPYLILKHVPADTFWDSAKFLNP